MASANGSHGSASGRRDPSVAAWMVLHVENLQETTSFYCDAFGFELDEGASGIGSTVLRLGGSLLHFIDAARVADLSLDDVEAPPAGFPQGAEVVLSTADLEQTLSRALEAGALLVRQPIAANGMVVAFVRDPNGALLRLVGSS